jgi:hypothetical protein
MRVGVIYYAYSGQPRVCVCKKCARKFLGGKERAMTSRPLDPALHKRDSARLYKRELDR